MGHSTRRQNAFKPSKTVWKKDYNGFIEYLEGIDIRLSERFKDRWSTVESIGHMVMAMRLDRRMGMREEEGGFDLFSKAEKKYGKHAIDRLYNGMKDLFSSTGNMLSPGMLKADR